MSLVFYPCKKCGKDVPARKGKDVGYCRYCGDTLTVTDLMKKYCGMSNKQIFDSIGSFEEFEAIFDERRKDDFNSAIQLIKDFAAAKKDAEILLSVFDFVRFTLSDVLSKAEQKDLALFVLDCAAKTTDFTSEHFARANKLLGQEYNNGYLFDSKPDKKKAIDYYFNLSKNPDSKADAFYWIYLLSTTKKDKQFWLEEAARAGHPKASEKLGVSTSSYVYPCEYMASGACTRLTNSLVIVGCPYFEKGEPQTRCIDYKPRV